MIKLSYTVYPKENKVDVKVTHQEYKGARFNPVGNNPVFNGQLLIISSHEDEPCAYYSSQVRLNLPGVGGTFTCTPDEFFTKVKHAVQEYNLATGGPRVPSTEVFKEVKPPRE